MSELRAYLESDHPRDSEIEMEFKRCLESLPDAGHDSLSLAEGWVWFRAGWLLRELKALSREG